MNHIHLKSLLPESVRSNGAFKSIFMSGIPGAGKSYVIDHISDGQIQPRIVNTDTFIEYISNEVGYDINSQNYDMFRDTVKTLTAKQLSLYINAVLPLFVDGTSNSARNLFRRDGILKSFGYDTGMIWIETDVEVAIERARKRDRSVPEQFIRKVFSSLSENKDY
jgi:shikimate kinase